MVEKRGGKGGESNHIHGRADFHTPSEKSAFLSIYTPPRSPRHNIAHPNPEINMYIDNKHAILLAINMLKYVGMPWDWDPFHTISDLTSMKVFVLVILFVIVPFISIKIPVPFTTHVAHSGIITNSNTSNVVLKRIEELSAPLAVTLMAAAVVLSQALFWYVYPIIILIPSCLCLLNRFANWLHAVLVTIPVLDVVLSATTVRWRGTFGTEPDHNEASEGDTQREIEMQLGAVMEDLEAGRVTV